MNHYFMRFIPQELSTETYKQREPQDCGCDCTKEVMTRFRPKRPSTRCCLVAWEVPTFARLVVVALAQ